jgi:hypothetical protein
MKLAFLVLKVAPSYHQVVFPSSDRADGSCVDQQIRARDDLAVIVDNQYNLVLALLILDALVEVRSVVNRARAELTGTDRSSPGDLLLLEATNPHRTPW